MKIAQISDPHIPHKADIEKNGVDLIGRFLKILENVKKHHPNMVVFTGDIVLDTPVKTIYEWFFSELEKCNFEYFVIAGNHDDSSQMNKIAGWNIHINNNELFYSKDIEEGYKLIFLDSSKNFISINQIKWLEEIAHNTNKKIIIFVHHPLSYCNCTFMDRKYPLININAIGKKLKNLTNIKYIFAGHYHTEKEIYINNIKQFLTPSTCFQIDQDTEKFKMHDEFGWREINLFDQKLTTKVKYL